MTWTRYTGNGWRRAALHQHCIIMNYPDTSKKTNKVHTLSDAFSGIGPQLLHGFEYQHTDARRVPDVPGGDCLPPYHGMSAALRRRYSRKNLCLEALINEA